MDLDGHDRPIFHSGVMCKTEDIPDDNVIIFDIVVSCHCIRNTIYFLLALIGVFAPCPELSVLVLSHPDVVSGELCSLGHDAIRMGEHELGG